MTRADKIILIQDLQCRLTTWLTKFNSSLSLAQCPEKYHSTNVQVTNFINVLYRYVPFSENVTNSDVVSISEITELTTPITIDIAYGATTIGTYTGLDTIDTILESLCSNINTGTDTHNYYCIILEGKLYLYTYDVTATFADTPTLSSVLELSITSEALAESNVSVILDAWNCITINEFCSIVSKIKTLLSNCKCN